MTIAAGIRLAVGTLTVIPTGVVTRVDRPVARTAMLLAPLAVLPLAVPAAGLGWATQLLGWPPLVGGLVTVALLALGTRALHLDGLADTADGLGSGWDPDRALVVMRRGDVGPMGVVALVLVLGAEVVGAGALVPSLPGAVQLTAVICCSRAALALVCRGGVPAARPDGLGAAVADSVPLAGAVAVWLAVAALLSALSAWRGQAWWLGTVAAAIAVLVVLLLVGRCVRRFRGVTGDVMGAAVEAALAALLVVGAR